MGHPRGLYILFFTEMWERFSYYGMRSLLVLYMVQSLHFEVVPASQLYGLYTGLVYLTPALGGLIADRYLGRDKAIVLGGILMALGHFTMVLTPLPFFILALFFIVLGCGLFKPSISVQVGALYAADDPRRDNAYSIFYMGINLGSFLAPLICGTLGQRLGWHYGFGAAGLGMLIALVVYIWGRSSIVIHSDHRQTNHAKMDTPASTPTKPWQRIAALVGLGLFGNIAFWATFEQAGTSLTLFADQSTNLVVPGFGMSMPSSWFQTANPLFIMLLTPLFAIGWEALRRRQREPSVPLKFVLGLALVAAGFAVMHKAGVQADKAQQVSPLWLLGAYFLNTCAELCISPVGLSVVTRLAPARWLSLLMGLWLASQAIANFIGGQMASEYASVSHGAFFMGPVWLAGISACILLILVKPIERLMNGVH
jgi:POT family proton-dependent oligopeptide transporter